MIFSVSPVWGGSHGTFHLRQIQTLYSPNEMELRLCQLIKLEFSPGEIAILTICSKAKVSAIRKRLYKKIFHKDGTPQEFDDYLKSL
jgi:hypothetical protein